MTLRSTLLGAGSALLLSVGSAAAMPAVAQTDLNLRSGPGPEFGVVATIPDGATVDVGGCTGSWCQVSFGGTAGFASSNYLAIGGGAGPSAGVVVQPGYAVDPGYAYNDDYYDNGYAYGPGVGVYVNSGYRRGSNRGWEGNRNAGNWNRQGWNGNRGGGWQGGGGRVGNGSPGMGRPQMSAPTGMPRGGARSGFNPGAAAVGSRGTAVQAGQGR